MSQPEYLLDEAGWVARIRAGDREAFEELFKAYYSPLCVFVEGYLGSEDATRELVQDVFIRIWENRRDLLISGSIKAYLFTAARNRALNEVRNEKTRRRLTDPSHWVGTSPAMGQPDPGADELVEANELEAAIREAVASLPERCRRVFELRSQHDLTHAEIARILGRSVKTVESQSIHALKTLRSRLARFFEP